MGSATKSAAKTALGASVRPIVLAIETSCDDTACAVLDGGGRVLASVVSSQLEHRDFGGVVPEVASRAHLENWRWVHSAALEDAGIEIGDVDVVAATMGPGLMGSLLVGLSVGKALAFALDRPFFGVHHLEGHLYSPFLEPAGQSQPPPREFLGLVASGGHTNLFAVDGDSIETVSRTRDDAMGECFDKVGKRLGLVFPAGAEVDALAELGDPKRHPFKVPRCGDSLDVSYSGLKTQALVEIEKLERASISVDLSDASGAAPPPKEVLDLLAGFRKAAVGQLLDRLSRLNRQRPFRHLAVSGGAAANRLLRRELTDWAEQNGVELSLVPLGYSGDNAAMIAWAALLRSRRSDGDDLFTTVAQSRLALGRSQSA